MKNKFILILALSLLVCALPASGASTAKEIADLKAEVASLKEGQEEAQKTLDEIKKLLESGARAAGNAGAFQEQLVDFSDSPVKGQEDATLTLLEFSDYQCPFCARHYRDVMPAIVDEYVATGKVKYVMKENPLTSIHKQAFDASLAALCAHDQGKYWEMHNVLFDNQKQLSNDDLKAHADSIGLDANEFAECFDSRKYEKQVNRDLATATKLGVRGTPGFLLGLTDPSAPNKAMMTVYIRGAQSIDSFKASIEDLLERAN